MEISVTRFRASCLKLIRRVETVGEAMDIKRRGKVVTRLAPAPAVAEAPRKPWERLRGSGELLAEPAEPVLIPFQRPRVISAGGSSPRTSTPPARQRSRTGL